MRISASLEMTLRRKTRPVMSAAWKVSNIPNTPSVGRRDGSLSGRHTRAKSERGNDRDALQRRTVTRKRVSPADSSHGFWVIRFFAPSLLASLSLNSDPFSSATDSDADLKRRNLRRGQQQQVNYCETSDSSDLSSAARRKNKPPGRPGKQRLSSDFSDGEWSAGSADQSIYN